MAAADRGEAPAVAIGIDIGDGLGIQFLEMFFHPFGGTDQAGLFGIPCRVDQAALWPLSGLRQLAHGFGLRHERHHPRDRICRAVIPAIVVIATDHPFIGVLAATQARDHVLNGDPLPVESQFESDFRRSGSDVISDGQRAVPLRGYNLTTKGCQQRLGIPVGDGQHGYIGNRRCLVER